MGFNFNFARSNFLRAVKTSFLRKRDFTYEDIQCASECLEISDILDMDSLQDKFIDVKDMIDR